MATGAIRTLALTLLVGIGAAACSGAERPATVASGEPVATTTIAAPPEPAPTPTAAPETPPPPPPTTTTTPPPPPKPRTVHEQPFTPFAAVAGITLTHPASRIERVGFHQSNHEGAQQLDVLPTAAAPLTLEARERLTHDRTAADVVVDPAAEIRSPVTGTVKRAGTYTLYCKYSDDYVVIEPDAHPGWEVKILHISGLRVRKGDRVTASATRIANTATPLPFKSQVDDHRTADPAWPHVHIEVVDPAIPNKPSPGGGC